MAELGNPQDDLRFIHLAGTNGKGSILSYTTSVLKAAGYTAGAYISPSVMGYLEKFQVNGEWMTEEELGPLVEKVKKASERIEASGGTLPTVFEMETAIAFLFFRNRGCDYVVLETGLGGDLDSTNVVERTEVCAFANISLDHTSVLGSTIAEIAAKKAGIIKSGAVVVVGWQQPEAAMVIGARAAELGCERRDTVRAGLVVHEDGSFGYKSHENLRKKLMGGFQYENATTAIEIIEALRSRGAEISEEAIREGIAAAVWPGRFECIDGTPRWILDGAHNPSAAERLREGLEQFYKGERIHAVFGIFRDKDYERVIETLAPLVSDVRAITLPDSERALPAVEVAAVWRSQGADVITAQSLELAIDEAAAEAMEDGGVVLITGSLSHLGTARKYIEKYLREEING